MPGYQTALIVQQGDSTALTASTTETSILNAQAKYVQPANTIDVIGKKFIIRAHGRISNIVTTPGTLTMKVKLGPTANIAIGTSQAFALNVVAKTNVAWFLDLAVTIRSVGNGTVATAFVQGQFTSESVIGSPLPSVGGVGTHMWQAATPVVGTGFDSTVDNIWDLTGTWSLNNANSIQSHGYELSLENLTP